MRRRVEETLDLLGLSDLRSRPIATLSGGQQQRVAIGSVLTPHPDVLVLDEPTSALDPAAAEEVLAVLQRLVHDLGTTVLMAEHRLERVIQYADQVVLLPAPARPAHRRPGGGDGGVSRVSAGGGPGQAGGLVPAAADDPERPPPGRPLRERLAGREIPDHTPPPSAPLPAPPAPRPVTSRWRRRGKRPENPSAPTPYAAEVRSSPCAATASRPCATWT